MGRLKKNNEEKKIKISITIDRTIYFKLKNEQKIISREIEKIIKKYYE
jgi:hypothetical protein